MMPFFITGTDTDCGKTYVLTKLLAYLKQENKKVLALKPVASGGIWKDGQFINEDVAFIQEYQKEFSHPINCWQLQSPIAPHLAAKEAGIHLSAKDLAQFCNQPMFKTFDYVLIEGAGGLMVPLNETETWLDFLKLTRAAVILVVGMKLGCLNHALLTAFALQQFKLPCLGWIANCIDNKMLVLEDNITCLIQKMPIPLLGVVPYSEEFIPRKDNKCHPREGGEPSTM